VQTVNKPRLGPPIIHDQVRFRRIIRRLSRVIFCSAPERDTQYHRDLVGPGDLKALETLVYAGTVIETVHFKTLQGKLKWEIKPSSIVAEPTSAIYVMIEFRDDGPDSAVWERVMIKHPVGKGATMLGNPDSDKARLCDQIASAGTLDQVNEIFRYVLLGPRKKEFEAAMRALGGPAD
jgi:hypothetical protein